VGEEARRWLRTLAALALLLAQRAFSMVSCS